MELNQIPQNPNNWGNVADLLNENSGKIEAETAKLNNATTKFKGYFSTSTALSAKWPSPLVGDTAWVGATYPGVVYRCNVAGAWLATTDVPPSNTVNLSEYATQDAVSNEFASVRSDLSEKSLPVNILNFEQGDFNTNGEETVEYAVRSKFWYKLKSVTQLTTNLPSGFRIYMISSPDKSTLRRVKTIGGLDNFENGDVSNTIGDQYVKIVISKDDLSSISMNDLKGLEIYITEQQSLLFDTAFNNKSYALIRQFEQGAIAGSTYESASYSIRAKEWTHASDNSIIQLFYDDTAYRCYISFSNDSITPVSVAGDPQILSGQSIFSTHKYFKVRVAKIISGDTIGASLDPTDIIAAGLRISVIPDSSLKDLFPLAQNFLVNEITFEQGNFGTDGESIAYYAVRSKEFFRIKKSIKLRVNISSGWNAFFISSPDKLTFKRVYNSSGSDAFSDGDISERIDDIYLKIVLAKDGFPAITPIDLRNVEVSIAEVNIDEIPDFSKNEVQRITEIEKTIYNSQKSIIETNESTFDDGSGKFYQAGTLYIDLFPFDTFLPALSCTEAFDYKSWVNIVNKLVSLKEPTSGMLPFAITKSSQAIYYSGLDSLRFLPVAEVTMWTPIIVEWLYNYSGDIQLFKKHAVSLKTALDAIPRDSSTDLCNIVVGKDWIPWGFEEIARFSGNVAMGSMFFWNAAKSMYRLYTALGDTTNATYFGDIADAIQTSLGESSPLWDGANGMFLAATGQCNQISIHASAYAVAYGIATETQKNAISAYLVSNFDTLTHNGYIRQSPTDWAIARMLAANGDYVEPYGSGQYQNGYWSVANRWVLEALKISSGAKAVQFAKEFLLTADLTMEHYNITGGIPTPSPTAGMLIAAAGTLQFIRENQELFLLRQASIAPTLETDSGSVGEIQIESDHIKICIDNDTWKKITLESI